MKTNLDMLMIKICGLLFLLACLFAVDCYMQYQHMVKLSSNSTLSTYAVAKR